MKEARRTYVPWSLRFYGYQRRHIEHVLDYVEHYSEPIHADLPQLPERTARRVLYPLRPAGL